MNKYTQLFTTLESLSDPIQSEKMSAYMKNLFPFLGIPKPKLAATIKPFLRDTKKLPIDWTFINACWDKPYREAQYVAIEYIMLHQKELQKDDIENLKTLITTKSWWETVDSLDGACGTLVEKYPELKLTMLDWSQSDNIWLRRVAIDFQQKYKEKTDTALLEKILVNNLNSDEFFINKAIGWSLRDYSKIDAGWVRDFLEKYKDGLSPLSVREASKYL